MIFLAGSSGISGMAVATGSQSSYDAAISGMDVVKDETPVAPAAVLHGETRAEVVVPATKPEPKPVRNPALPEQKLKGKPFSDIVETLKSEMV